jgi:hypothetical protein
MAAGGMGRSEGGFRPPLNRRRLGGGPDRPSPDPALTVEGEPVEGEPPEVRARPCWVVVVSPPLPGTVHAWRRDPSSGEWRALVAVWLPASAVQPREG